MAGKKTVDPIFVLYREDSGHAGCSLRIRNDRDENWQDSPVCLLQDVQRAGLQLRNAGLVMRLAMHAGLYARRVQLLGVDGFSILRDAVGEKLCHWLRQDAPPLKWGPAKSVLLTWEKGAGRTFSPALVTQEPLPFILPMTPPVYVDPETGTCGPLETAAPAGLLGEWMTPRPAFALERGLEFCRNLAARYPAAVFPLPGDTHPMVDQTVAPTPCLCVRRHLLPQDPGLRAAIPVVRLSFDYGLANVHRADPRDTIVVAADGKLLRCRREQALEDAAVARLRELGFLPVEETPAASGGARLMDWLLSLAATADWSEIQDGILPALAREGWQIRHDPQGRIQSIGDEAWYSEVTPTNDGWFDFHVGITVDGRRANLLPAIHHLLMANRDRSTDELVRLLENRHVPVALEPEGFALVSGARVSMILRDVLELSDASTPGASTTVRLDAWRVAEIARLEAMSSAPWNCPENLRGLITRLQRAQSLLPAKAPRTLRTALRPYQALGLAWLEFLREGAFGGILADDMGLGKTVQTLAHLLAEKKAGRLTRPALVVSPTSVIQNWVEESRRFAPSLRTLVLHGAERHGEFARLPRAEVVFTTYPLLRRDAAQLQAHTFSVVILDEAQYIKNHLAVTTQIAGSLKCERRLCLTGTPLENHLGELWSLFHFLMPGFLGSEESFRTRFREPIERRGDDTVRQFLTRRVGPFLLRRRKSEVEKDLPAKTITTQSVDLTERQQQMYESVRLAMQSRIRDELEARGLERSRITILNALMKLRQICCDPRLAKTPAARTATTDDSAKLQTLMELLPEMLEEGRRILLFSQFVGMLTLIEAELNARAIPYALLTGVTRDRAAQVRRFQNGDVSVFLISLKAGGTGLNLTAADTVIHYDPWWNPAVENQATDRAHRIGQDKPVFVYRLIAAGTVEARIHALQARKQMLADGVLQEQKVDSVRFSMEDLSALLAPIAEPTPEKARTPRAPAKVRKKTR